MIDTNEIETFVDTRLDAMQQRPGMWGRPGTIEGECLLLIEVFSKFCLRVKTINPEYLAFRRKHFPKCSTRATTAGWLTDKEWGLGLEDNEASQKLVGMFIAWKVELKATAKADRVKLIWWLTEEDCRTIGECTKDSPPAFLRGMPKYLQEQYDSRNGRAGRGRLWSAPEFGDVSAATNGTALCLSTSNAGGIVLWAEDLHHLQRLPGLVTTLRYERV